jgi:hypothetical protein
MKLFANFMLVVILAALKPVKGNGFILTIMGFL